MGTTIENCINELLINKEDDAYVLDNETIDFAIDAMRKYEQIEEAYTKYLNDMATNIYADRKLIKALSEVFKNGNDD